MEKSQSKKDKKGTVNLDIVAVLWYIRYMEKRFRETKNAVSKVNYHLIFCSRYRRKIFLIAGLEARFREIVTQICEQHEINILELECNVDHCELYVDAPPDLSPAEIVKLIRKSTGAALKREFFPTTETQLWTRKYFVSTDAEVSPATVREYVNKQVKRGGLPSNTQNITGKESDFNAEPHKEEN